MPGWIDKGSPLYYFWKSPAGGFGVWSGAGRGPGLASLQTCLPMAHRGVRIALQLRKKTFGGHLHRWRSLIQIAKCLFNFEGEGPTRRKRPSADTCCSRVGCCRLPWVQATIVNTWWGEITNTGGSTIKRMPTTPCPSHLPITFERHRLGPGMRTRMRNTVPVPAIVERSRETLTSHAHPL